MITEVTGQFFHDVPNKTLQDSKPPAATLDIHGIISYTTQLPTDLARVAHFMDPGTALMMVATETRTVVVTKLHGPYSLPQYLHYSLGWFKTQDHTIFTRTKIEAVAPELELGLYIPNKPSFRIFMEPGVKWDPWDLSPFNYSIAQTLEDIRMHLVSFENDLAIRLALQEDHKRLKQIWLAAKRISPRFRLPTWAKSIDLTLDGGLKSATRLRGIDESANKGYVESVDNRTINRVRIHLADLKYEAEHTLALLRLAGFP